jgi:hypothetical protein
MIEIVNADTGRVYEQIELVNGELVSSIDDADSTIENYLEEGRDPADFEDWMDGWSNGYVVARRVDAAA